MKPYKTANITLTVNRLNEAPIDHPLSTPETVYQYYRDHLLPLQHEDKEHLWVLLLDNRHKVKGHHLVSMGALNETTAHPREIFRPAIATACAAIILVHNHPSGDPNPSEADRRLTRKIAEGGTLLGIELLDHIIATGPQPCGREPYFSFREGGLL